jgi:hypothetical protein
MMKFKTLPQYRGQEIHLLHSHKVIVLGDDTPQEDLERLFKINHEGVVAEDVKKQTSEVK